METETFGEDPKSTALLAMQEIAYGSVRPFLTRSLHFFKAFST